MKKFLSLMLAVIMLSLLPVSAALDDSEANISLSEYFNYDIFFKKGSTFSRTTVFPKKIYDGTRFEMDNTIKVGNINYCLLGGMDGEVNDTVMVSDGALTLTLGDTPYKKIGFIAFTEEESSAITATVKYKNGTEENVEFTILPMIEAASFSVSMDIALKKGGSARAPEAVEGTDEVFLNSYEISPSNSLNISQLVFNASQNPYIIAAVTTVSYTGSELEDLSDRVISDNFDSYKDKKPSDLADTDLENLESLYNALLTAKEAGKEIATDDNILKIYNLKEAYKLYSLKKSLYTEINDIYFYKDYLNADYEALEDSDVEKLDNLIEYYEEANEIDMEVYNTYLTYFDMTDEYVIDISDKDIIVALKENYLDYKYEKELKEEIEALYAKIGDKTVSDIEEDDIADFEAIIALFEEARENGIAIDEEKASKLESVFSNYTRFNNSEKDIYYDLSPYFTGSIVADAGEKGTAWGITDGTDMIGYSTTAFKGFLTDGIYYSNGPYNFVCNDSGWDNDPVIPKENEVYRTPVEIGFKMSDSYGINGKNAILIGETEVAALNRVQTVNIKGSGRMTDRIFMVATLNASGNTALKIALNFTDGTSLVQNRYVIPREAWGTMIGMYFAPRYVLTNGVVSVAQSNSVSVRGISLIIPEGKTIKDIDISGYNGNVAVLAVTETPIANAEFLSKAGAQWEKVKNIDISSVNNEHISDIRDMVSYVYEADERGIAYTDFGADTEKIEAMKEMVLNVTAETYRENETTVISKINFTVPVSKDSFEDKITVLKNGSKADNFSVALSADGKAANIRIQESRNGGNIYSITVSKDLQIEKYNELTLGNDYSYQYTVPDYISYTYDNQTLWLTNNSKTAQNYFAAASLRSEDENTTYTIASFTGKLEAGKTVDNNAVLSATVIQNSHVTSVLWDDKMKTISNDETIPEYKGEEDNTANYDEPSFTLKDNSLKVAGYTPSKLSGKIVNMLIEDDNGRVIYAGSQKTSKNGYFSFTPVFPTSVYYQSFNMNISVGGDDFAAPHKLETEVYFSSAGERMTFIEELKKKQESEIIALVDEIKKVLALDFAPSNAISDSEFGKAIFNNKNLLDSQNPYLTQSNLKIMAILAAYSGNDSSILFTAENEFMYDDIMNYSGIDIGGVTLYSIYKNAISQEGKTKVRNMLMGNVYNDRTALIDAIERAVFLCALNYPVTGGTGYVKDTLTAQNANAAGVNISNYLNTADKVAFNTAIVGMKGSFTDIASIEAFIRNYVAPALPVIPSGSSSSSGGGVTSTMKTSGVVENSAVPVQPTVIFNDVASEHWAYQNIISLYNKGIISGKSQGIFAPDDNITRGEVVKILCVAYGFKAENVSPFSDTAGKWYESYAAAAYENGIITGISADSFGGDLPITRQDLSTILCRISEKNAETELLFSDSDMIAEYAKPAVKYMYSKGIVNGFTDNTFRPYDLCSRSQCAKIIDLFLKSE